LHRLAALLPIVLCGGGVADGKQVDRDSSAVHDIAASTASRELAPARLHTGIQTVIDIDSSRAGSHVYVRAGEALRIRLLASSATGYGWVLDSEVPPFLWMESDPGIGALRRANIVNAWTFRANGHGRGVLRFALLRTWNPAAMALRTATFYIHVD